MEASTSLSGVGQVFTQIGTWVGSMVTTISNQPLLLIPVGIMCFGAVIGLCSRLIGR